MKMLKLGLTGLVLVAAGAASWYFLGPGRSDAPKTSGGTGAAVPVVMAQAETRDLPVTLAITGRTEAVESVTVKARIDGQVRTVAFVEGGHVRRGDVLLRLDPADFEARLRQAEATLARDRAQLVKARTDVERYTALRTKGFVSDEKVGEMRTAAAAAEATVNADQAAVDLARLQLGYTTVVSPIDGFVGARLVFPGSAVKINDTALAVVNRTQPINIVFAVAEKFLPRLRAQMAAGSRAARVTVRVPDTSTTIAGELRFIDNAVDTSTGTIQVKAVVSNESEALKPGQFVNVELPLETLAQAVTVPAEAVQQGPEGAFVYVVTDDTAQVRKLRVAAMQGGLAAIAEGLRAGERVVTDGQLRLVPGAKVRPAGREAPSAATPGK
jgi:multidrug efflux system membrane fusion protein